MLDVLLVMCLKVSRSSKGSGGFQVGPQDGAREGTGPTGREKPGRGLSIGQEDGRRKWPSWAWLPLLLEPIAVALITSRNKHTERVSSRKPD